jgi:secretion/DNA translocation related CpaE-like protein
MSGGGFAGVGLSAVGSSDDPAPRPLLVCADEVLLDDLLRLCAVAGVDAEVVPDAGQAATGWAHAPLVLIGGDCAEQTARLVTGGRVSRRDGVVLVSADLDEAEVWRRGVEIGAGEVVFLPAAEEWLLERIAAVEDGARGAGTILAVAGGRGGAGASVLAAALAVAGVQQPLATMLVDADPLGGGLDLAVGAEQVDGLRWPALAATRGRLGAGALGAALPALGGLIVLSWDRDDADDVPPEAMATVLDAGARGSDLVVVDLPRRLDAAARFALARATTTLLVVPAEVRACAAAARVAHHFRPECADLRLVVRGPGPGRLAPTVVEEALGIPLVAYLRSESAVATALERGEPPGRRSGALARGARELVRDLVVTGPGKGL